MRSENEPSRSGQSDGIRGQYQVHGVRQYYQQFGGKYRNPHEPLVEAVLERALDRWNFDLGSVLDLACGSGEATLVLARRGADQIVGCDPFTSAAYQQRTGRQAWPWSFEEIAAGALASQRFTLIVASYALHLIEPSRLPGVCWQLSLAAQRLLVLTPHKRPVIEPAWGWDLVEEFRQARIRARCYASGAQLAADEGNC